MGIVTFVLKTYYTDQKWMIRRLCGSV